MTPPPLHPPTPALPLLHPQLVGAQLTQLQALSMRAANRVLGPDGRPAPASELLGGLPALSRLTRLTSLTVHARSPGPFTAVHGVPARAALRALPPGALLKKVGHYYWGRWARVQQRRCSEGGVGRQSSRAAVQQGSPEVSGVPQVEGDRVANDWPSMT